MADLLENPEARIKYNDTKHFFVKWIKHIRRTIVFSYYLAKITGADLKITTRAAALHDIDDYPLFNHSKKCAEKASEIEKDKKIIEAIRTHMFPLSKIPKSKEAWVLTIADKLAIIIDMLDF